MSEVTILRNKNGARPQTPGAPANPPPATAPQAAAQAVPAPQANGAAPAVAPAAPQANGTAPAAAAPTPPIGYHVPSPVHGMPGTKAPVRVGHNSGALPRVVTPPPPKAPMLRLGQLDGMKPKHKWSAATAAQQAAQQAAAAQTAALAAQQKAAQAAATATAVATQEEAQVPQPEPISIGHINTDHLFFCMHLLNTYGVGIDKALADSAMAAITQTLDEIAAQMQAQAPAEPEAVASSPSPTPAAPTETPVQPPAQ